MYICNFKLNIKKILITVIILTIVIALFVEISSMLKTKKAYDWELNESNFTEVLQTVHNNIEENIGKTVKLSGFIFKLPDFEDNYFVCGRNMLLDGDEKVVGFLCTYDEDVTLAENEWIEIEGEFVKGFYVSDMPVIKVSKLTKIPAPANTYVDAPSSFN